MHPDFSEYGNLKPYLEELWRDPSSIDDKLKLLIPRDRHYIFANKFSEQILDTWINHGNTLFVGEPSTGKSEFVLKICSICNIPLIQIQGDGEMGVIDIIGTGEYSPETGTGFIYGILPEGIENKCWILMDEINMIVPEVLARTHSMLDDRRHLDMREVKKILELTEDNNVIGTMNPNDDGRHIGTKPLAPALRSRMHLEVPFDFLEESVELKVLLNRTNNKLDSSDGKKMIRVAEGSRESFRNKNSMDFIDTRMLIAWAQKTIKFGIFEASKCTVLSRLDEQTFDTVRGLFSAHGIGTISSDATPMSI